MGALPLLLVLAAAPQNASDSFATLAAARAAQAGFERLRVDYLPRTTDGTFGPCDEIVGRFCYWHGGDDDWVPPPEHERIRRGRERLIAQLDSLARLSPGDDWIVGQRVRYLVEATRPDDALRAAEECRGTPSWCRALAGYTHHAARRFAAADSSYADALAAMSFSDRCDWNDLSVMLAQVPRGYARASCTERASVEAAIWWLADPLYLTPGNERRTEHYTRHVLSRMQDGARSGYAVRWGGDLEELLLRYGWPAGWERDDTRPGIDQSPARVISHHAPHSREFMPPRRFVEDVATVTESAWDLDPDKPRSGYAPPYAREFVELTPQVAVFWRGDSALVVAAVQSPRATKGDELSTGVDEKSAGDVGRRQAMTGDETRRGRGEMGEGDAALVISAKPEAPPVMVRQRGPGPYRLAVTVPAAGALVSVEALTDGDSAVAGRARHWLALHEPPGLVVSQPLFFAVTDPDSVPTTLEAVFDSMLTGLFVASTRRLGVYWETYPGAATAQVVRATLTVTRTGASWLRRAAQSVGLASRVPPSVSLDWSATMPRGAVVHSQSLAVTLPEGASGRFTLQISMEVGGRVARSQRVFEVTY